ncbi:MAG: hypothetical protein OXR66_00690 [Candidatus Woesearchaeota archaeon]|nr:hypothetical protein [Candidatus Woesearchaeota archaeon]
MTNLKFLNSKEVKRIHKQLAEQYGYEGKLDYIFMLSEKKQKIYLFSKDLKELDVDKLRIDSMGLYFGAFFNGKIRLTIEGTQLIGKECTQKIVTLVKGQMQSWMLGNDLEQDEEIEPGNFVIMQHEESFIGCGKYVEGKILNYIPKTRYVHALY